MGSMGQKNCLSRNMIVCVLSFGLLSCIEENLIVLIAIFSSDHLNKRLNCIALKVCEKMQFFHNVKGTSLRNAVFSTTLKGQS